MLQAKQDPVPVRGCTRVSRTVSHTRRPKARKQGREGARRSARRQRKLVCRVLTGSTTQLLPLWPLPTLCLFHFGRMHSLFSMNLWSCSHPYPSSTLLHLCIGTPMRNYRMESLSLRGPLLHRPHSRHCHHPPHHPEHQIGFPQCPWRPFRIVNLYRRPHRNIPRHTWSRKLSQMWLTSSLDWCTAGGQVHSPSNLPNNLNIPSPLKRIAHRLLG